MSLVLYRKYRPKTFAEIIGQEHIVKVLKNALLRDKIAHAYLFTGPRGTGKTTIARLLAKAVNCEKNKGQSSNFEPCNKCSACIQISEGRALDLIEIDAASSRGIDEIRELKEKIGFSPSMMRYRIFIIDEVHMLTKEAFNALLKTLEEPPNFVIFILATTEIHKVPATIISRCQRFDFRKLAISEITNRLEFIAKNEKVKVEKSALEFIGLNSDGCLRDAESLFGQVLAMEDKDITLKEVQTILGAADSASIIKIVKFFSEEKLSEAIFFINKIADSGYDLEQFNKSLINFLRKALLIKADKSLVELFSSELTKEQKKELLILSDKFSEEKLIKAINLFISASFELKKDLLPQIPLELAIVELLGEPKSWLHSGDSPVCRTGRPVEPFAQKNNHNLAPQHGITMESSVIKNPAREASEKKQTAQTPENIEEEENKPARIVSQNIKSMAGKKNANFGLETIKEKWDEILLEIKKYNHSISAFLKPCRIVDVKELNDKSLELIISTKYNFHQEKLSSIQNRQIIEKTLEEIFKRKFYAKFELEEKLAGKGPARNASLARNDVVSSGERSDAGGYKIKKSIKEKSENLVASALEMFGGKKVEK